CGTVLACTDRKSTSDMPDCAMLPPFVLENDADTLPSSTMKSITWIPIEHSPINPLKEITNFCSEDSKYIIASRRQGIVQAYDLNGHLLYEISRLGQGPEEYLEIAAVTTTESSVYIVDNFSRNLVQYSITDGSFVAKRPMQYVAWDVAAYNDSTFLFTCLRNNPDTPASNHGMDYAVWQTDRELNVTHKYLPVEADHIEMYCQRKYFTKYQDKILFHTFRNDGYFIFDQDGSIEYRPMEFPDPIDSDRSKLNFQEIVDSKKEYLGSTPYMTENYTLLEICKGDLTMNLFADNANQRIFQNSSIWAAMLPVNIIGVCGNDFIGHVNDEAELYESMLEYGFPRASQEVEDVIKAGGCALIRYSLQ
ncbi:MAG: 6-bladed beta-propeller, partial [Muribaculaceae bacterium]|nr:6-bladed beta-propeller [Muribaculaceae bacterium]